MVIAHSGKAGQWSKQNAIDEHRRAILLIFVAGAFLIATLGYLAGLLWHGGYTALIAFVLLLLVASGGWKLIKLLDRALEQGARRRLQYLRGGQAEAWVSMILRDQLGDRWHLFDNLMLDANSDIDHVLVGPGGLFVISTKSQRGLFQAQGHGPDARGETFNTRPCPWVRDAVRQTMRLKDQLAVVEPAQQPWVQTVLALPFAHVDAPNAKGSSDDRVPGVGPCWVLHEDNLTDHLEPESIPKQRKLSKTEVERWVEALDNLHEKKRGINTTQTESPC